MPKVETWLKRVEIEAVEDKAIKSKISRSAWIKRAVQFAINYEETTGCQIYNCDITDLVDR